MCKCCVDTGIYESIGCQNRKELTANSLLLLPLCSSAEKKQGSFKVLQSDLESVSELSWLETRDPKEAISVIVSVAVFLLYFSFRQSKTKVPSKSFFFK